VNETAPYTTRTLSVAVCRTGDPIWSELTTTIAIVSEGAGEFVEVSQPARDTPKIAITPEEWPAIRDAVERMIGECRDDAKVAG